MAVSLLGHGMQRIPRCWRSVKIVRVRLLILLVLEWKQT